MPSACIQDPTANRLAQDLWSRRRAFFTFYASGAFCHGFATVETAGHCVPLKSGLESDKYKVGA